MSTSFIAGPRPAEQGAAGSDLDRRALRGRVSAPPDEAIEDEDSELFSMTGLCQGRALDKQLSVVYLTIRLANQVDRYAWQWIP